MRDIISSSFIIFVLLLYVVVALVFVMGAARKWIWAPLAGKLSAHSPQRNFRAVKSNRRQESSS